MRTAAALFIAAHGIGYSIWFLGSWIPAALGAGDRELVLLGQPATGPIGKALGLLALAALAGFLAAAWGLWQQTGWWQIVLLSTMPVAVPIALLSNPVAGVSVMATLANIGLVAATLMPWGDRLLGGH